MKLHPIGMVFLAAVPGTLGWGAAGHEIIATIAEIYLHPTVMPTICAILDASPNCHLAPIASWADRIKWQMRWSASLHYVGAKDDYPSERCEFPGPRGWNGREGHNVLGAIRNVTGILAEWADSRDPARSETQRRRGVGTEAEDESASEALKFLVHFIGDMHMPLHLTGRDRGGNGDKVTFDGRVTNLHSVWDSYLIAQRIRTLPRNYTRPLPLPEVERVLRDAIYDPYVRRLVWEGLGEGGRWPAAEMNSWFECPSGTRSWAETLKQAVLGYRERGEDTDDDVLCPYHWAKPIHQLNCDFIWPAALDEPPYKHLSSYACADNDDGCLSPEDEVALLENEPGVQGKPHAPYLELDTPEYAGLIREGWVVERLVAMAGLRLAGTLNWLFADLEEEGDVRSRRLWIERVAL
ncbi:phospholipase C/P1 nuclease [Gloeophyllum trabeum ATCC 11539]|uniref:Phospholipase C/P1 nuclease n=1 Tax=Gloeophyllum trabeum (strain ATCC 11539 / FP-39264 / Madison 617) TaxID=670483 RepID=S7Q1E1_GLOTA|nr:phospholipase C/P1 nuclease [Gloeophyllum trabeum ATCC 11539]EPQ53776.1 phospholipase C/P1 nuclease [Gloeophyllum trabeum ATCC 11539]